MSNCVQTREGVTLAYQRWGTAGRQPLLFLHASGCHSHWWDRVGPMLADEFDVIAPDLRGHGDSHSSPDGLYDFETYAADVARVSDALGLESFVLVGHSMGGYVGATFAAKKPAALRGLVIADMLCELNGEMLARLHQAAARPQPTFATREEAESKFRLQPPETRAHSDILKLLAHHAVRATEDGRWTFKFDRRALRHPAANVWDLLPPISVPVLVVRGEMSPLMSKDDARRVAEGVSHGTWTELSGAYHNLMLDDPEKFVATVRDFARELV
jgi:pimeloyl-ACP methyl ester carboxylesterase